MSKKVNVKKDSNKKRVSSKKPKEIDGFLKYQFWKAQNQFGAEYDNLGITKKD